MSVTIRQPVIINDSKNVDLKVIDIVPSGSASGGYIVSGSNFSGYNLTLQSGFAAALWTALGDPSTLYSSYPVTFSCGNGNSYSVVVSDSNLITTYSTTLTYNSGYITSSWQPTILFVLTDVENKVFTLYG